MDEKAPKIDDKKFAAHMNKNKKPKTMTPGQKSFADIRKRADSMAQNPKIVRSRKSSPSLRRKLINATEQDMSGMCCKNCGDMYGKPTKENRSCMYNAYDPKGKNWINAEKYHEAMVNPQSNLTKKQRQALASPAAKAKPPSQVSVKKAPFPIPDKKDVRREEVELDEAKLNIKKIHKAVDDGKSMDVIVGMFANRRTTNTDEIRKIVKDYKFKKRMRREAFDFKVNIDGFPEMFMSGNSPSEVKTHLRKLVKQPSMIQSVDRVTKADKKKHHRDKVNESLNEDAPCWDTHKQVGMKKKGNKMVPNCVPKNEDNVDELSLSRKDITKSGIGKTGVDKDKIKKDLEKLRKGLKREAGMKRMSTGDGMDTFRKKPPEVKKANEKTSGKVDYGSDESIKMMKKKTPGEKNEQNRFNTMLLPKLQKAKAALANMKKTVMGTNPTGNQQRKKYVPGIRQNIRNK